MINKIVDRNNKKLIVFFSGASKKSFESLFVVENFEDKYDIVEVIVNYQNTTFGKLKSEIREFLDKEILNYENIFAICKSFGGVLALITEIKFDKYIFLASPVILGNSSLMNIKNTNLSLLKLEDIVFSIEDLKGKEIVIFQGNLDKQKILNYSNELSSKLGFEIKFFETGHSFENVKEELEKNILDIFK